MLEIVILDFDGTLTDIDQEYQYISSSVRDDLSLHELQWETAADILKMFPDKRGLKLDGIVVAPPADNYLFAANVASLADPNLTDATITTSIMKSYRLPEIVFKPEAKDFLNGLISLGYGIYIVTNSSTNLVHSKLTEHMGANLAELGVYVFGNAQKYLVSNFSGEMDIRESAALEGLDRPAYLRRGKYLEILNRIWAENALDPTNSLVVGDVFELDLLLPAYLGSKVALLESPRTFHYEKVATAKFKGNVVNSLMSVLARIR